MSLALYAALIVKHGLGYVVNDVLKNEVLFFGSRNETDSLLFGFFKGIASRYWKFCYEGDVKPYEKLDAMIEITGM